jgi:hypothetical protein
MKPEVTVNPTGESGAWGMEKARRITDKLVAACDRSREQAELRKSRRKAPG